MHDQPVLATMSTPPSREVIHDLRNLFGVLAAAGRLLEDDPSEARRAKLLSAIASAAERGGQLTTDLLARRWPVEPSAFDACARLATLEPMMQALAGRASIRIDRPKGPLPVRADTAGFDAAILELVANARAALSAWNHITVRVHAAGKRIWLTVADDGDGMDAGTLATALDGRETQSANGTGLGRVSRFAREADGSMHIRSRKGRGTVVSLNLPMVISGAVDESVAPKARHFPQAKEKIRENRQPIAA
ncbi:HAMP domain-containing sensor histidine kinase [Sphingomonas oligophenolica]|uniref:histidine kinase n=1 Tax=Sphingomonas oligophenolica TaxID=301154 RepID=A0ABU9Y7N4_9SPHN